MQATVINVNKSLGAQTPAGCDDFKSNIESQQRTRAAQVLNQNHSNLLSDLQPLFNYAVVELKKEVTETSDNVSLFIVF